MYIVYICTSPKFSEQPVAACTERSKVIKLTFPSLNALESIPWESLYVMYIVNQTYSVHVYSARTSCSSWKQACTVHTRYSTWTYTVCKHISIIIREFSWNCNLQTGLGLHRRKKISSLYPGLDKMYNLQAIRRYLRGNYNILLSSTQAFY